MYEGPSKQAEQPFMKHMQPILKYKDKHISNHEAVHAPYSVEIIRETRKKDLIHETTCLCKAKKEV